MPTNTARIRVGRLLEVDVRRGYHTVSDVDALFDQLDREVARLEPSQHIVTCADWRHCTVMAPDTSARLVKRLGLINARTERSAAVVRRDSPTAVMQFARLIREANFPDRRVFYSAHEAINWLGQLLNSEESARLRRFLEIEGASGTVQRSD
jgi:hypothetical protein